MRSVQMKLQASVYKTLPGGIRMLQYNNAAMYTLAYIKGLTRSFVVVTPLAS